MKEKVILMLSCLFLGLGFSVGQTVKVTGTVIDSDAEPVISASVVIKGTQIGTVTDLDGRFSIHVPEERSILVFTFIGMKPLEVKASTNMKVVMEADSKLLDDVVILGYGSARKGSTVIGSVSSIKAEEIELKPSANIMDALQGKVAGMQSFTSSGEPGAVSSVYIRGIGTLNAGAAPLYVLDGAPVTAGVMLAINQNDVESVNVLKDASATSIYGSRAANGVIYVTTKRGKVAENATIRASFMYGVSSLARRIGTPMNARELLDFQLKYGVINQSDHDKYLNSGNDTDWRDYFFKDNVPTYNANLSISGGGGNTIYYVSGGYLNQKGTSIGSRYEKYNIRSNVETRANNWLRLGLNIGGIYEKEQNSNYTHQASNSLSGGIFGSMLYQPYFTPYDEKGNKVDYIEGLNRYSSYYNTAKYPRTHKTAQVNGSLFFTLTPIEGLTLRSQGALEGYDYRFTKKNYPSHPDQDNKGLVGEHFSRNVNLTITNTAEYKFNKGVHNIILLAGQEAIKNNYESFGSETTGQSDDRLMLLSSGTEATFLKGGSQYKADYVFSSFFGRIDYNYDEKYFADISVRNDGSSRFGKNNKYATFLSGGLMWNLKKEDFLSGVAAISALKIKGSVGSSGNASVGNYAHFGLVGVSNYNADPGWIIASPGNENLKWEKQIKTDITAQLGLFNKYNIGLTYYIRKTKDMLLNTPLPFTTGFSSLLQNVGELTNRGFEIEADIQIVNAKDFTLDLNATYSHNTLKIDKLFHGLTEWPMYESLTYYIVGKPMNYFIPKYAGVDPADGYPMWHVPETEGETTKTYSESLYQNSGKPRYAPSSGGFGINASYKGIYFIADFAWVLGKYLVNNDRYFTENPGNIGKSRFNQSTEILGKIWEKPGDAGKLYTMEASMEFDDHLLENASFMRLKNLTIGYNFPKAFLNKTNFFEGIRIFGTARNLFTVTKYKGADPEIDSNLTYGAYPNSRQFNFGLEVTF